MAQVCANVVLVSGCSSGIGRAICEQLSAGRARVYGGSRRECASQRWSYLPLDVRDEASVAAAIEHVLRREGRIDTLIGCAGVGLAGALEDTADDEAREQFEVNFFGSARMIRAILPTMRKQGSGKIILIGSIAGLIGLPFAGYYSAGKFALAGLVEALRGEVAPLGIQATIVHPGDLNTAFTANRIFSRSAHLGSAYADTFRRTVAFYAAQERNAPGPEALARKIEELLSRSTLPGCVVVGSPLERLGVLGKAILPARSFEYLFRKAYSP